MISPEMQAEVILASEGFESPPLYSVRVRCPRIIWAEVMTHRVFSRNARSSRAVPVATMLAEVRDAPFIPWHWGKNQKGMQATEECNEIVVVEGIDRVTFSREEAWQLASLNAASVAEALMNAGYHKQVTNRLLEPFMWIDALISATEWKNFIALRDHKAAEPHFRDLAQMMKEAIEGAPVQYLAAGQWHTPYVNASEGLDVETSLKVSAARCARISYAPFDGKADIAAELARYDLLMKDAPRHASPVEHQATPGNGPSGNFAPGWIQYRKTIEGEALHG